MTRFYNTLTRKKEVFTSLIPDKVSIYSCGITAYDDCHIGHARSAVASETIKRYLEYRGFIVTAIRNVTDIDDKIIHRAVTELRKAGTVITPAVVKKACADIVALYYRRYRADLDALGLDAPSAEPRATDHIEDMHALIQQLIDRGYAYEAAGDVYFNVKQFAEYGKLSHQKPDALQSGVGKDMLCAKRDPLDFALWKASKEHEPFWASPWGPGRPGWHIECSCMSMKYLGSTFDIHIGGEDLIFPHHENEIAQSEAATGVPFARWWMHHGLLTINGQKMSKSLGNFVRLQDALVFGKDALKLLFLSSHYRSAVDFTFEKLEAMKHAYGRFEVLIRAKGAVEVSLPRAVIAAVQQSPAGAHIDQLLGRFEAALDDDINTPVALAQLFEMIDYVQAQCGGDITRLEQDPLAHYVRQIVLEKGRAVFGLFQDIAYTYTLTDDDASTPIAVNYHDAAGDHERIEAMIARRNEARANKDFATADQLRDELLAEGIILEDTKNGATSWRTTS